MLHSPPSAANTEQRLLDAAERSMSRYGLRRVSMGDVATEAGLSRASVYRYFPDRRALVDAVLARTAARFVAASEPTVDGGATLAEQVAAAARFIVGHRNDETFSLGLSAGDSLFAELLTTHNDKLFAEWVEFWPPRLSRAQAAGEVAADIDPHQAGEWIVRLLFSFAVFPSSTRIDLDRPEEVLAFVQAHLLAGLAPRTP